MGHLTLVLIKTEAQQNWSIRDFDAEENRNFILESIVGLLCRKHVLLYKWQHCSKFLLIL